MQLSSRYHLVELDRPASGWSELEVLAARARSAAEQVNSAETPVRFLRTIFVPDDEKCFQLFEGTPAAVAEAVSRAHVRAHPADDRQRRLTSKESEVRGA